MYLIRGGGHAWPGRPLYLPERTIGKASQAFSATDVIWQFFKTCPPRVASSS
jgi:polyhydroxybutyrate depolymerase